MLHKAIMEFLTYLQNDSALKLSCLNKVYSKLESESVSCLRSTNRVLALVVLRDLKGGKDQLDRTSRAARLISRRSIGERVDSLITMVK